MLTTHQLAVCRNKLHSMRADLDSRVASLRDDASHGVGGEDAGGFSNAPIHIADLASQESEAVVNVGLAHNEAVLRQEIDEALLRFEEGTFGVCEECRNAIALARLEAVPYSRLCIRCAERSQQDGRS